MAVNVIDIINGLNLKQLEREANRLDYVWESEEGKELEIRGLDEYSFKDESEEGKELEIRGLDEIEYSVEEKDQPNLDEIEYNFLEEFEKFFSEDPALMPELSGSDMGKDFVKKLDCLRRIYKVRDSKIHDALSILNDETKTIRAIENWIKGSIQKTLDGKGDHFISRLFRPTVDPKDFLATIIPPNLLAIIEDSHRTLQSIVEEDPEEFVMKVERLATAFYLQKQYLTGQISKLFLPIEGSVNAMFHELSIKKPHMRLFVNVIWYGAYLNRIFDEIKGPVEINYLETVKRKGLEDIPKYDALKFALSCITSAVLRHETEDDCKKEIIQRLVVYLEMRKDFLKMERKKDGKEASKIEEIESLISSLKRNIEPLGESSLIAASIHSAPCDDHDNHRNRFFSSNDRKVVGSRSNPTSLNPSSFLSRASGSFRNSVREALLSSPLSSSSSETPNFFIAPVSPSSSSSQSQVNSASPSSSSQHLVNSASPSSSSQSPVNSASPRQDASSSSSSSSSQGFLKH